MFLVPPPARGAKTALLVAATGGHLAQLVRLRPRLTALDGLRVVWATFDTPQSRALLRGEDVVYVRFTASRDLTNVLVNSVQARRILREVDPSLVVSTGSAIALSFLPLAAARGIECHYVESAARGEGPSLTGRLLRRTHRIHLYTQHRTWAREPWFYRGSVFDAWEAAEVLEPRPVRRMVVTLGTMDFPFRRLLERLVDIIPAEVEVLWQVGATDASGLPIQAHATVPNAELDAAIANADVVVSHSGIGSAIAALEADRCPVLVAREQRHGEHIDDHQRQIAFELSARGLAVARSVPELTWEDVRSAAALRPALVVPPAFALRGSFTPTASPIAGEDVVVASEPSPGIQS